VLLTALLGDINIICTFEQLASQTVWPWHAARYNGHIAGIADVKITTAAAAVPAPAGFLRHFFDLGDATKYAGIHFFVRFKSPLLLLPLPLQASCVTFPT
jgi:hypothetical protein